MNGELLLEWMSHVGAGTWPRLRETMRALCDPDDDAEALIWHSRTALIEFGHAEFDADGRWTMHRPALYTRPTREDRAFWLGARTRRHVESLRELASICDIDIETTTIAELPHIAVAAPPDVLSDIAATAGFPVVTNLAEHLASRLEPIQAVIDRAESVAPPVNWSTRSFDPARGRWIVDEVRRGTIVEFKSPYNEKRWLLERRRHDWVSLPRRMGVHAACAANGVEAARYDADRAELQVRSFAPLPPDIGRVATICSGSPERREDWLAYVDVPLPIAAAVLVSLNVRHPGIRWCA